LANPALLDPPRELIPYLAWEELLTVFAGKFRSGKSTLTATCGASSKGRPRRRCPIRLHSDTRVIPGTDTWRSAQQSSGWDDREAPW
jgi:hypothetical protein